MLGRLVSWLKRNDCTCDPYYGILGSPCPSHPVWQPHDLRDRMQRKCVEWGVYWRAPDAHGIQVNVEQATELLADAVGVEVEITCPQDVLAHGQPVVDERISRAWKLVERWEQPTIDGDTLTKEERLRNMGFAAMLRAALGATP